MKIVQLFFFSLLIVLFSSCKSDKFSDLKEGLYVNLETDRGEILIQLHFENTPNTVANFVSLAEGNNIEVDEKYVDKAFYDGLKFHEVLKQVLIQTGDPEATGYGGTGYKFEDEFPTDKKGDFIYRHDKSGMVSMVNAGEDTNSSQFFITLTTAPNLDGKNTIFGQVVKGLDVLKLIEKDDVIDKVKIIRKGEQASQFDAVKLFSKHLQSFEDKLKRKYERKQKQVKRAKENEALMQDFIIKKKKLAKRFGSGLRMYIIKDGKKRKPKNTELVSLNVAGYFEDGRLFYTNILPIAKLFNIYDEEEKRNLYKPLELSFSSDAKLISGLKEGMLKMKFEDKALLFIPPHLAYGEEGNSIIPPNTPIVYEIELIKNKINK